VLQLLELRKEKLVFFPDLFLTEGTEVPRAGGVFELQECPAFDITDDIGRKIQFDCKCFDRLSLISSEAKSFAQNTGFVVGKGVEHELDFILEIPVDEAFEAVIVGGRSQKILKPGTEFPYLIIRRHRRNLLCFPRKVAVCSNPERER
jgi:hypothetical protein